MASNSGKQVRKALLLEHQNPVENGFKEIKPLNEIQSVYLEAIKQNDIVFLIYVRTSCRLNTADQAIHVPVQLVPTRLPANTA
jgi:hypothetical protein